MRFTGNTIRSSRWKWDGDPGAFSDDDWLLMIESCKGRCLCCGNEERLTIDHVKPLDQGGRNEANNIQPLCRSCNSKKGRKEIDYRQKGWPFLK